MPEYTGFVPYSTSNMVNLSNGSFTYNLPLLEVPGGYPINLSYNSASVNPQAPASWVGFGWNLNPGTISLTKRGFPDTYDSIPVTYYSRMPRNWTLTAAVGAGLESFGGEKGLGLNAEGRVSFNNYKGITTGISAGISGLAGFVSLNFDYSGGKYGFNPSINPAALFSALKKKSTSDDTKYKPTEEDKIGKKVNTAIHNINESNQPKKSLRTKSLKRFLASRGPSSPQIGISIGGFSGSSPKNFAFSPLQPAAFPTTLSPYVGAALDLKIEVGINGLPLPFDPEGSVRGSFVFQDYENQAVREVYGYLHSEKALNRPEAMMDYYTENENMYEKRDKYLGIPFPNNDVYVVSGEGISGTFRAHRNDFGHYRKNQVTSNNFSVNSGADVNLASIATSPPFLANLVYTLGVNYGGDYTDLSIGDWDANLRGDADQYRFRPQADFPESDEQFYFRFSNDKSFSKGLGLNSQPERGNLEKSGLIARPRLAPNAKMVDDRNATSRSSYIRYSYLSEFMEESNGHKFLLEEKNLQILNSSGQVISYPYQYYNNLSANSGKSIAEFRVTNSDGMNYVYGLPAYVKNEKNLNYSVKVRGDDQNATIQDNKKIAKITGSNIHATAETVTGYTCEEPYAGTHLLTGITGPDYVDRENDGLTPDDFGTYTRFNYQQAAGGTGDWYVFRTPYTDAGFQYGSLSSNKDDMASYSSGDKEVYYLQSISSKTHVAIFRLTDREDGGSAKLRSNSSMDDYLKGEDNSASVIKAKKLTRIDLYAIADCKEMPGSKGIYEPDQGVMPIKSVRFEYDYSLCKDIPNNTGNDPDVDGFANQGGKLTLKKVWFEYGGTLPHRISPYQFEYEYPTNVTYPNAYNSLANYGGQFGNQNPLFKEVDMDRWGNYRNASAMGLTTGLGDLAPFFPYVYQNPDYATFDPAAWHLKQIKLPGGGEVHVQYEEGDYQYVQDRPAMIMVPLSTQTDEDDGTNNKYYLDLAKIGIPNVPNQQEMADALFRPMREELDRMYFNFLYALIGGNAPDPGDGISESIEGFARIAGYGWDNNGIYFVFKESSGLPNFTPISYPNKFSKREIPRKVCKDFYNTNRRGLLTGNNNALSQGDDESKIRALITLIQSILDVTPCKKMAPEISYVRLEAPKAKKGGATRVKRLLMYDAGIDPGGNAPVLFGQEYFYQTMEKGRVISSGVASNEPSTGRMENALVQPIDKSEQGKLQAILYGRDMYGQLGPIGEYLMPGPGITYSNVLVSNIHKGKTSTGFEIHEFFTSRTHPFRFDATGLKQVFKVPLGASYSSESFGFSYSRKAPFFSQGYAFYQNEMDGQPKRIAKYSAGGIDLPPIAEEVYEYYEPHETLKLMNESLEIENGFPGREAEILSEIRQVKDITNGGNVEPDLSAGAAILPPPIFALPVVIPTLKKLGIYHKESTIRTHVTNKIISYPAILKRSINRADGVTQESKFEVFDRSTGEPLVVRTYDDFAGSYLSQEFRANWNYLNLGKKSRNEGLITNGAINYGVDSGREYIEFSGTGNCGEAGKFSEGDFIILGPNTCTNSELLYHVDEVDVSQDRLYLFPSGMKTVSCVPQPVLNSVKILRSGFTNQLGTNMGGLMTHSSDGTPSYFFSQGGNQQSSASHPFIDDLNQALDNQITFGGNQSGTIQLPGPYQWISIPTDECILQGDCGNGGLKLQDLNFSYQINNGVLSIQLISVNAKEPSVITSTDINCADHSMDTISIYRPSVPVPPTGTGTLPIDVQNIQSGTNSTVSSPTYHNSSSATSTDLPTTNPPPYQSDEILGDRGNASARVMQNPNNQSMIGTPPIYSMPPTTFWNPSDNQSTLSTICSFPTPRTEDFRYMGNSNRRFFLQYKGNPTESILRYCGGGLQHSLSWNQEDRSNVNFWINVTYMGPEPQRTWNRVLTGSGNSGDYTRNIILPGNFTENGLYKFDIYMERPQFLTPNVLRWLTVYKCVNTCPPNNQGINGGGELCLDNAGSHTFTTNPASPTDFGPFTYSWKITGPEPTKTFSSTGLNATFSFATPGSYSVELTVTDKFEKSSTKTTELKIINCNVCNVDIDGPQNICLDYSQDGISNLPTQVSFSRDYLNNCIENTCTWSVYNSNGNQLHTQSGPCNSTTQNFTYNFTQPGIYFVKVRSTNNNSSIGGYNEETQVIRVKDCRPPRADFAIDMGPCPDRSIMVTGRPMSNVPIGSYQWNFGDGTMAQGQFASHNYSSCGPQTISLTVTHQDDSSSTYSVSHTFAGNEFRPCHGICDCTSDIPLANWANFSPGQSFSAMVGKFKLNALSGGIGFAWPDCPREYALECWRICNPSNPAPTVNQLSHVISASATTFSGTWDYDHNRYPKLGNYSGNPFESGIRGRWLPEEQYVYRTPITQRTPGPTNAVLKNLTAGTFDLEIFDWQNGNNAPDKWVKTNTTNHYTPNSEPEEDENILQINSTAKYGYENTLLILAAQNASRNTTAFESFENEYGNGSFWEDGIPFIPGSGSTVNSPVFTGKTAVQLSPGQMFEAARIVGQGEPIIARIWGNRSSNADILPGDFQLLVANGSPIDMKPLTEAGEWTLYEAILPAIQSGNTVSLQLRTSLSDLVVDDLRVQPYSSEMVCYVYDHAQRLLASFDDQHFPLLYQYNEQGQLVRKLKVTREGTKTISETQYNTKGTPRF